MKKLIKATVVALATVPVIVLASTSNTINTDRNGGNSRLGGPVVLDEGGHRPGPGGGPATNSNRVPQMGPPPPPCCPPGSNFCC